MSGEKPSVIVFGGINHAALHLAFELVPDEGESPVAHVRFVDRFSVVPATTFVGSRFPKLLEKPNIEYKQANLLKEDIVKQMFDPPEGYPPYSIVIDITGEIRFGFDMPEQSHIDQSFRCGLNVGREAARRNVKAIARLQPGFYISKDVYHDEKEDMKPVGPFGCWYHEALRAQADLDLPLVVVQGAIPYGYNINFGPVMKSIMLGAVYQKLGEPMKFLHTPGKHPMSTAHIADHAGALWACAKWMASVGKEEARKQAGVTVKFNNDLKRVKDVPDVVDPKKNFVVPLFFLSDDSNSTLKSMGETVAKVFGIKFGFYNQFQEIAAKFFSDYLEDINQTHVEAWTELLMESPTPIPNTPMMPYMTPGEFGKLVMGYKNDKLKKIIGYKLKHPLFNEEALKETVKLCQAEKIWPDGPSTWPNAK